MINPINRCRIILPPCCLLWIFLLSPGCAHDAAPGKAFAEQTVQASSTQERKGELVHAVDDLKVALAADPDNSTIRDELNRLVEKRNREAEKHYKAGLALLDSNPKGARKELVEALRIRDDYPEAASALRRLQLTLAESAIDTRSRKEARLAAEKAKAEAEEDEESSGEEYSLDTAISSFDRGDFDTAILEFSKMKARYPNDPDIQAYLDRSCYNSGVAWFNKKDYNRALASFARVPKGFEHVDEYVAHCKTALKSSAKRR